MTPEEAAQALADPIGWLGGEFMTHTSTFERADDLGLHPWSYYFLGRGGVLGDPDPDVIYAAMPFFGPDLVRRSWANGRAVRSPGEVVPHFVETMRTFARNRWQGVTGRLVELLEKAVDGAPPDNAPLFAGWRALDRPDDEVGRASQLAMTLREHRGGLHIVAVLSAGLTPLEATVAYADPKRAEFFGWDDVSDVDDSVRKRRAEVEWTTHRLAASAYRHLSDGERDELVKLATAVDRGSD